MQIVRLEGCDLRSLVIVSPDSLPSQLVYRHDVPVSLEEPWGAAVEVVNTYRLTDRIDSAGHPIYNRETSEVSNADKT